MDYIRANPIMLSPRLRSSESAVSFSIRRVSENSNEMPLPILSPVIIRLLPSLFHDFHNNVAMLTDDAVPSFLSVNPCWDVCPGMGSTHDPSSASLSPEQAVAKGNKSMGKR